MASRYTCTACMHAARRVLPSKYRILNGTVRHSSSARARESQHQLLLPSLASRRPSEAICNKSRVVQPFHTSIVRASGKVASKSEESAEKFKVDEPSEKTPASSDPPYLTDAKGNRFVLITIPDDVRTLSWRSADWTWGVMERLLEDCEQAKVTFEMEDYVDEEDGKTKKRVKRDEKDMHAGQGTGWWFEEIGLPKTFNTWAMVCFLHMWMLKVRLRQWPKGMSEHLSKMLSDHFFWKAEETMDFVHKMTHEQRHKHMDHYFQVWTGTLIAYDEGLVKGDAVLATALWRLIFQGEVGADPLKIQLVTRYVRKEIARLAALDDKVILQGYVGFGEPPAPWNNTKIYSRH